ncbi:transglycosylase SLT domain-containing protein [Laspinema sp. D1]|uniref:Transglycosylase SLT domain-containing protein n=2 Tax=Laspinema TaxID=2584823 RepID=A0ABT2MLK8_9CYAN|nr:transglycosylase SLT domain-containing protein [Laspinema sp. D2a]
MFRKKQRSNNKVTIAVGIGLWILLIGAAVPMNKWIEWSQKTPKILTLGGSSTRQSAVKPLALMSYEQRASQLEQLALNGEGLDRSQARYMLANDLLEQGQATQALESLQDLEKDYGLLAPYILFKRAQAYELSNNSAQARETWTELLENHPESPVVVEALYALGKSNPQYWDQALEKFPAHPKSMEIAQTRLKENPNRLDLLLPIASHGFYLDNYKSHLQKLTNQHRDRLTPENWEAIAFGYWEKQDYGKGGEAYASATWNPQSAYRLGRGRQLSGDNSGAILAYKRLFVDFPDSEEASMGLEQLITLVEPKEALTYIDELINRFPNKAGEALFARSKILDELGSRSAAKEARDKVLSEYSNSEGAAELRWSLAQQSVAINNFDEARKWALELRQENPDSELAPEAGFWAGKWAQRLGLSKEARQTYEDILFNYTESYYAWRSAVLLGWDVGDFTNVRALTPAIVGQTERIEIPVGSDVLKELYLLGQDQDAWTLWQVEFTNRREPSVPEQFTDGLIRLGVGDNLDGIFMLSSLRWRDKPEDQEQYKQIKVQPHYWEALYPFPYADLIQKASKEEQMNPLLVTALMRQESRFMPKIRSSVGAVGLMQVMPETGSWAAQSMGIKNFNLEDPEDNIKIGTWYLDFTHGQYKDNSMLAVASYNAGPSNVASWIEQFGFNDPDEFADKIPFPETNGYVKHVFENYWNYLRLYSPEIAKKLGQ